jgi:nicotinamide mononucleotide transporter
VELSWSQLFTSELEFVGFVTGILSVLLLLPTKLPRLQYVNWFASIASAAIYLYLFHQWGLYGNAALQVPFLVLSFVGAWTWRGQLRGVIENVKEIPTTYAPFREVFAASFLAVVAMILVYPILAYYGDPEPWWDGLILTVSLSAIFLQLRKRVQSWYLWIVVDLIAVPFHFNQERPATALLYLAYMAMCFVGWYTWHKEALTNQPLLKVQDKLSETTPDPTSGTWHASY